MDITHLAEQIILSDTTDVERLVEDFSTGTILTWDQWCAEQQLPAPSDPPATMNSASDGGPQP